MGSIVKTSHLVLGPGIYRIVNTVSGRFYVGSAVNVRNRAHGHLSALRKGLHANNRLQKAWVKYGADAFRIEILEKVVAVEDLLAREQHYLDELRACEDGYNLNPSAFRLVHTEQTIAKIRKAASMQRHSEETKAKLSEYHRNRSPEHVEGIRRAAANRTAEHRAKIGAAHRGKKLSDEAKRRISEFHKGKTLSDWHKERLREAGKGRKHTAETIAKLKIARASISDETRKRMSEGQRGRRWSPEQRAKVLAALIGRPVSVETRAKRAEARRNDSPEIRAKRAAAIRAAYARKREAAAAKDSA